MKQFSILITLLDPLDDEDLADIDNLSPKQAEILLHNLDAIHAKIKGKTLIDSNTIVSNEKSNDDPSNKSVVDRTETEAIKDIMQLDAITEQETSITDVVQDLASDAPQSSKENDKATNSVASQNEQWTTVTTRRKAHTSSNKPTDLCSKKSIKVMDSASEGSLSSNSRVFRKKMSNFNTNDVLKEEASSEKPITFMDTTLCYSSFCQRNTQ
ncbi:hypothetical protein RIF29_19325 [Crotalaria pallida]|uniref:Uncharacterized protein n=1 Tax=Crotalaria pallida TaxID=3830 RepID=A0AAN9F1J6_CROPI